MPENKHSYIEERIFDFVKDITHYVNKLPKVLSNIEAAKQLMRSSSQIGTNYIEAKEAYGKSSFANKVKISKIDAKETHYWLGLSVAAENQIEEKERLKREAQELTKVFMAILRKIASQKKKNRKK